jgi:hypothetical protein
MPTKRLVSRTEIDRLLDSVLQAAAELRRREIDLITAAMGNPAMAVYVNHVLAARENLALANAAMDARLAKGSEGEGGLHA